MRKFKFRICYTDLRDAKHIIYNSDNFYIGLDGNILENYGDPNGKPSWEVPFDVWTPPFIQQWTGLQDKNGKDIYEGDLLNFKLIQFGECEIHINQEVKYCNESGMFVFGEDEYGIIDGIRDLVVVGNIYESSAKI
jgi:hypothetical protein